MSRPSKSTGKQEPRRDYFERLVAWAVSVIRAAEDDPTVSAVIDQMSGKAMFVRKALRLQLEQAFRGLEDGERPRRASEFTRLVDGLMTLGGEPGERDLAQMSPFLRSLSAHSRDELVEALDRFGEVPQPDGPALGQVGDAVAALRRLDGDPDVRYALSMDKFAVVAEEIERETRARMSTKAGVAAAGGPAGGGS